MLGDSSVRVSGGVTAGSMASLMLMTVTPVTPVTPLFFEVLPSKAAPSLAVTPVTPVTPVFSATTSIFCFLVAGLHFLLVDNPFKAALPLVCTVSEKYRHSQT